MLFGEDHPFRKILNQEDDMFTVSAKTKQASANNSNNNPFASNKSRVNLLKMIDPAFFEQPAESQSKLD